MSLLKNCFSTIDYKDALMDIDGDEVMDVDEEEKMDIDNYNISDFLSFSYNENVNLNENLVNIYKLVRDVCNETKNPNLENLENFHFNDKKDKNCNEIQNNNNNNNEFLNIKSSLKGFEPDIDINISEGQNNNNTDSVKIAQYIIDSLVYNSLDDLKSSPPTDSQDVLPSLSEIYEDENNEGSNEVENSPEVTCSQDFGKDTEGESNLTNCLQDHKLLKCKVLLKRVNDKEILSLKKSLEVVNESYKQSAEIISVEEPKEDSCNEVEKTENEIPKKRKEKKVSLGQITVVTYNSSSSPIKSDFKETKVNICELSAKLKNKLLKQREISKKELLSSSQSFSCLSHSSLNSSLLCEVIIGSNTEVNNSPQNAITQTQQESEKQDIKNCSVKLQRLPMLEMFLNEKKQTSNVNLKLCCLCEEKKLFLSKESLIHHLQEVHFKELLSPKMKLLLNSSIKPEMKTSNLPGSLSKKKKALSCKQKLLNKKFNRSNQREQTRSRQGISKKKEIANSKKNLQKMKSMVT